MKFLRPVLIVLLAVLALFVSHKNQGTPSSITYAQADLTQDVQAEFERIIERVRKNQKRLWIYTYELRELLEQAQENDIAPPEDLVFNLLDDEHVYLRFLGSYLILTQGFDGEGDAYEVLLEVIEENILSSEEESDVAVYALRLLTTFPPFEAKQAQMLGEELVALLTENNDQLSAQAKVALVRAEIALLEKATLGIERLKEYLKSEDYELKNYAALALAELGLGDQVQGRLQALAQDSGELAIMARMALELQETNREIERYQEAGSTSGAPEELLEGLMTGILNHYDQDTYYQGQEALELNAQNLVDSAGRAMVSSLDDFSEYMTSDEYRKMSESSSGSFAGVGAFVTKEEDDPAVRVSQPIYSGPAYEAGLRSGDYLWEAEVGQKERRSLVGLEVEEVVKLLRGPVGTQVKIWVKRPGVDELQMITLTRAMVDVDTALEVMLPGKIGYLRLTRFGGNSAEDMRSSLENLKKQGMKGLILDLRDNPGGRLDRTLEICDIFLPPNKPITRIQGIWGYYKNPVVYTTKDEPLLPVEFPMVTLINDSSASGAELLSGSLQDHNRCLLIGEKSFGKGIGQSFFPITEEETDEGLEKEVLKNSGRILKCTIFSYYIMPSGLSVDRKDGVGGVTPDIEVYSPLLSSWEFYKLIELRKSEKIDRHIRETWEKHKDTYMNLAHYDSYDEKAYPGFEELYQKLETKLSTERVRNEMRRVIRVLAADERAEGFHQDYQNDYQLQRSLLELSKKIGLEPEKIPNYSPFLKDHESQAEEK